MPSPLTPRLTLPHRLPRKLWGKLLEQARRLPGFTARERAGYEAIEADLLGLPGAPGRARSARLPLPPAPVIREALAAGPDYRLLDPADPRPDDTALLAGHRLDPARILANRGLLPPELLRPERLRRRRALGITDDPHRIAFQLEALDQGAMEAVCPVTGRVRRAVHGLLAAENQPIFYWFPPEGDAPAMLLATGREGRGWIKLYLFLPALGTALLLADRVRWHGRDEIDELRAHLIARHRPLRACLARTDPPRPWVLVDGRQFAHHLWNALSGLERLATSLGPLTETGATPPHVAGLSVCAEPWGPVESLFPELRQLTIERSPFPAPMERAMRQHRLLLRVGGTRVSEALVQRVRRVAAAKVDQAVSARVTGLRHEHRPILWVTLRLENRTWVSQVPGLIHIGQALAAEHPQAALIIDGFSVPYGPANAPDADHARLIAAEQQAAAQIIAGLTGRLPVVSLVGRPLFEVVAFAQVADCYFAHHGSLQHKIGWLGDCPGLVHANRLVLTTPMLWEAALDVRPGQVPPTYLDPALVRDVPGARRVAKNRWLDDLDNYDMDAAAAYAALAPLLGEAMRTVPGDGMH
jgi:hypothetical protein